MPDYVKMYQHLFRAQTKAIELLQEAQKDTEEIFISSPETNITVLETKKKDGNEPDTDQ